ncbi:hypothetical protein WJX73_004716 [Symbiochloris irregularis]|uniref:RRM domain-containing protein n=1 Tax=Symbiochloris irregularis TaxID=706552 RepID=A0AAW1NLH3_9CHLO
MAYVDPYAALRGNAATPADPEELAKQMQEQQLRARQMVLQQQAASATAAASKTQREVYVGNLVSGLVAEEALRQLFNSTMRAAFPDKVMPGFDPVVTVSLHSEGRYAFVELRTPEMASAALSLSNQVQLLGQPISVGRPSGYVDPMQAQTAAAAASAALAAFKAGDTATMETQMGIAGIGPPQPSLTPPGPPQQQLPPPPGGLPPPPSMGISPPVTAVMTSPGEAPTLYLQVEGMVTAEVLADDEEYNEVIEDLKEECGKHGPITSVVVPRPPNPAASAAVFGQQNYGKAYVSFADAGSAAKAKDAVHGRLFAGITVVVTYLSAEQFAIACAS